MKTFCITLLVVFSLSGLSGCVKYRTRKVLINKQSEYWALESYCINGEESDLITELRLRFERQGYGTVLLASFKEDYSKNGIRHFFIPVISKQDSISSAPSIEYVIQNGVKRPKLSLTLYPRAIQNHYPFSIAHATETNLEKDRFTFEHFEEKFIFKKIKP